MRGGKVLKIAFRFCNFVLKIASQVFRPEKANMNKSLTNYHETMPRGLHFQVPLHACIMSVEQCYKL